MGGQAGMPLDSCLFFFGGRSQRAWGLTDSGWPPANWFVGWMHQNFRLFPTLDRGVIGTLQGPLGLLQGRLAGLFAVDAGGLQPVKAVVLEGHAPLA
mmetsp:Transcript_19069/g.31936  ORF Transcript_19069/g.31936 Transcript_19069/m.31936 type:complete len:97 (-) Transcript_19069:290-580(-)